MQRRVLIFLQKSKNTDRCKRKKTVFFRYFISDIPNFSCMGFFRKYSMFRRNNCLIFSFKHSYACPTVTDYQ